MALQEKNYMDLNNLNLYDTLLKSYVQTLSNLSIKTILFSADGNTVYFYKKANAILNTDTPDYTFSLNNSGLANRVSTLENKGAYSGGTKVNLNGTDKTNDTASFYAPIGAGNTGQVLVSQGSGAPTWQYPTYAGFTPSFSGTSLIFTLN